MRTSGLAAPPRAERPPVPPPVSDPPLPPPNFQVPRRGFFEGVLGRSILGSVLLHLLLLLLASQLYFKRPVTTLEDIRPPEIVTMVDITIPEPTPTAAGEPVVPARPGTPQAGAAAPANAPTQPAGGNGAPLVQPPTGGNVPGAAPAGAPGVGGAGAAGGGADALRPGYRDARLYGTPDPFYESRTRNPDQVYAEQLSRRIQAVNDSMAAEASRNATTRDWMFGRWGLSSDGLHLGGVTIPRALIPNPRPTGDNATREAAREQQRQRDEIQRQEAERERIQQERAAAAREAADQRRSGGSEPPPGQ